MDRRSDLISAAAEAIEEVTVEGLTVREVARRAKQSTIGIYRNFSGKTGLLEALFRRGYERLGAAAEAAGERESTARAAILASVREYLELAKEQPQHYRLMFTPATAGYTPTGEARHIAFANYDRFVALVERLPGIRSEARRIAADLLAMVHGHVALRSQDFGSATEASDWTVRIIKSVERQLDLLDKPL